MLTKRIKSRIIGENQKHDKDTGSAEVQVAMLSRRIDELAGHLKKNPKGRHSRRGLLRMVSLRRRLLRYLLKEDPESHKKLVKKIGLEK